MSLSVYITPVVSEWCDLAGHFKPTVEQPSLCSLATENALQVFFSAHPSNCKAVCLSGDDIDGDGNVYSGRAPQPSIDLLFADKIPYASPWRVWL